MTRSTRCVSCCVIFTPCGDSIHAFHKELTLLLAAITVGRQIHDMMAERIREYFKSLGLEEDKARELHQKYYREYGLAIRGLVKHHDIGAFQAPEAGVQLRLARAPPPID